MYYVEHHIQFLSFCTQHLVIQYFSITSLSLLQAIFSATRMIKFLSLCYALVFEYFANGLSQPFEIQFGRKYSFPIASYMRAKNFQLTLNCLFILLSSITTQIFCLLHENIYISSCRVFQPFNLECFVIEDAVCRVKISLRFSEHYLRFCQANFVFKLQKDQEHLRLSLAKTKGMCLAFFLFFVCEFWASLSFIKYLE